VISIGYYIWRLGASGIVARSKKGERTDRPIIPLLAYQGDPIRESVKGRGRK